MPSLQLDQRPAFCRTHPSFIVVSTYQLESEAIRAGSLVFFDSSLNIIKKFPTPAGVFRFEFPNNYTITSALTNGSIHSTSIKDFSSESVSVSSNMLLDVSCYKDVALTSDNKGQAFLVDLNTSTVVQKWLAHKLAYTDDPCEVWTCSLNDTVACTGGDDSSLRLWDTRSTTAVGFCKLFEAGVTYTEWIDDNIILTGSYDQKIRLLDRRNLKETTKEMENSGGVWNICTSEIDGELRRIAACMYGGYVIYDKDWNVIRADVDAGKQLLYGADILDNSSLVYTTFNDYSVTIVDN